MVVFIVLNEQQPDVIEHLVTSVFGLIGITKIYLLLFLEAII